jgi:hypothetical protein
VTRAVTVTITYFVQPSTHARCSLVSPTYKHMRAIFK